MDKRICGLSFVVTVFAVIGRTYYTTAIAQKAPPAKPIVVGEKRAFVFN